MTTTEIQITLCLIGLFVLGGAVVCLFALSFLDEDVNPKP